MPDAQRPTPNAQRPSQAQILTPPGFRRSLTSDRCPLPSVLCLLSSVFCPLSSVARLRSDGNETRETLDVCILTVGHLHSRARASYLAALPLTHAAPARVCSL